ncbi:hypothetical protein [Gordonia polyisoprenivorans]|uniref:hypothetical protein n=1 Tax=Gordonia polyisoprenivorans TaxID=84595 RepID=UPI0003723088|nr:hypothetical protein [Gordonia polyisoprenivorans]
MTSPHERDGRCYGYNQDPYTRDPYRDPYTGDDSTLSRPADEADIAKASPPPTQAFVYDANHSRRHRERSASVLPPLVYLGGMLAAAAVAGLGAWVTVTLGVVVVDGVHDSVIERMRSESISTHSAADSVNAVAAMWIAVVLALVGGVVAWGMRLFLPMPMTFFRLLCFLLFLAAVVNLARRSEWQLIPYAAALVIVPPIVVGLLAKMSEHIGRDHRGTT